MSDSEFIAVCAEGELAQGQMTAAEIDGRKIVICHGDKGIFALDDLCTHNAARLFGGRVKKNSIACPMHGARFDLETGECLAKALGCQPIVTHQVRLRDGMVEVALADRPVTSPLA